MDLLAAIKDLQARVEALENGGPIEADEPESISGGGKVGPTPEVDEDSGPIEGTMTTYDQGELADEPVDSLDLVSKETEVEVGSDESAEGGYLEGLDY